MLIQINKYKWKEKDFPSENNHLKKCEKNNVSIAHNVLYIIYTNMSIYRYAKANNKYMKDHGKSKQL